MESPEFLTHDVVCKIIESWGSGNISDQEIHDWAEINYFPAQQKTVPGMPDYVALAIGIVLTVFECTRVPFPFQRSVSHLAIAFINSSQSDFKVNRDKFLKQVEAEN